MYLACTFLGTRHSRGDGCDNWIEESLDNFESYLDRICVYVHSYSFSRINRESRYNKDTTDILVGIWDLYTQRHSKNDFNHSAYACNGFPLMVSVCRYKFSG